MMGLGTMIKKKNKQEDEIQGFIDLIFSWSIADIMNQDLYKDKVNQIPETFSSVGQYFNSFITPLIEETHADLRSNITTIFRAPSCEILGVKRIRKKDDKNREKLTYRLHLNSGSYEPEYRDLIVLTEVKPKCINDLNRSYTIALVETLDIRILSSKPIVFKKEKGKLFASYLTNLNTNSRIWKALNPDINGGNFNIINSVLTANPSVEERCSHCSSLNLSKSSEGISHFGLDESQKDAVLNCIATTQCHHKTNVKLIWGPPGTGKTITISALVFALLEMKCGTLICAPTNIAVVGVAKRLLSLLGATLMYESYGLGDVVLFGNGERMKIDDHDDLLDIFLDHRVDVLARCFSPLTGWHGSLVSLISLLEDPEGQYLRYLSREKVESTEESDKDDDDNDDDEVDETNVNEIRKGKLEMKSWKELINRELNDAKKRNMKGTREKSQSKGNDKDKNKDKDKKAEASDKDEILWTFEEFFTNTFKRYVERLMLCMTGLYTHMPTSCLPLKVVKKMNRFLELLQTLQRLVNNVSSEGILRQALKGNEDIKRTKLQCLKVFESFRRSFSVPENFRYHEIKKFCLENACLIFCTASSSVKLHTEEINTSIQMVIIDEAAQLKECESSIPLQLSGVRNAVLVGDEKQLPAMVQSKICEKAGFGRSLFERLVILGHSKHLLNVQYRMHPSISLFPNSEFYGNQIKNGQNVMKRAYKRRFLKGKIFGSYSFIDVNSGKEEFDDRRSKKNMEEVSVVAGIVSKLYQESAHSKQKVRVGCISPYKAQVHAIQERLGKTYSTDINDKFSVNVRSVDGFQGGEEDIIIISTVRCNGNGSVGFLSNCQRTNVALTRARHCLWILGNGATLLNSGCVWEKLVRDAKSRGCFYNASDDKSLALAISNAKMISLFNMDSILFKTSKWKVCFSDEFHDSMIRLQPSGGIHDDIVSVLVKLSNGWRQMYKDESLGHTKGRSSQLLEIYDVKEQLKLIWSVEILEKNSQDIQVIKIWDILPRIKIIPKLAKKLDVLFDNYSDHYMSRCICKRIEGNLTLPMKWPVDSNARSDYSSNDPSHELSIKLTAISLN
ncbi:hypothetical protein ACJIZ3_023353 [Penstemon smallii]|uniref:Uncharacterized protein n=1 Tax=Penstemon smallii TaxID=265156 RepID=A0ABD3TR48_9LAMI